MPRSDNSKDIYAVIPAYNEEDTIGRVVTSVKKYTPNVVVVDDGSRDRTASLASASGAHLVIHSRNLGYDKSIDDGFHYAAQQKNGYVFFTFDADGQHNTDVLDKLLKPLLNDQADVVVGVRPYKARIAEILLAKYTKRKYGLEDPLCGLKAYKKEVYDDIGYFDRINSIGTELMIRAKKKGYRIMQVPITIEPRADHSRFGQSLKGNFRIFMALLRVIYYL